MIRIFTNRMTETSRTLQASTSAWMALMNTKKLDFLVLGMINAALPPDESPAVRITFTRPIGDKIVQTAMEEGE